MDPGPDGGPLPLLTAVKTTALSSSARVVDATTAPPGRGAAAGKVPGDDQVGDTPFDRVLGALRSQDSTDSPLAGLRGLCAASEGNGDFQIFSPNAAAAQMVHALLEHVVPNYWGIWQDSSANAKSSKLRPKSSDLSDKEFMLLCLRSVTGLGAINARLRTLTNLAKSQSGPLSGNSAWKQVADLLDLLETLLDGDDFVQTVWMNINKTVRNATQRLVLWKEMVSILCQGSLLNTVAESYRLYRDSCKEIVAERWIADGRSFSGWIGRNGVLMASQLDLGDFPPWKALGQYFGKSFSLGYTDQVVSEVYNDLVVRRLLGPERLRVLLQHLLLHEQRLLLQAILRILPGELRGHSAQGGDHEWWSQDAKQISGAAAVIYAIVRENEVLTDELALWTNKSSGGGVGEGIAIRRAVVAVLSRDIACLQRVLEKSLQHFGDKLYIKHTPVTHQEVNTQILLLTAGYVGRHTPEYLSNLARSSTYLNAISNRLAATSERSRFLGMVTGTSISALVDPPERRMKFSLGEMSNDDARWYQELVKINDAITEITDLRPPSIISRSTVEREQRRMRPKAKSEKLPPESRIISIEEIEDDDEEDEDDLVPYAKPDSDPEDEEEDATLVQRTKYTTPVYIRDIIGGLRDSENYDRHRLALSASSALIRRKATFGTEVRDHAKELASLLTGLADKFEMERFQEMRQQAMIALVVAQPNAMGPWFARAFFEGDYSMSQRASILTTLGMAARDIAGYAAEDASLTGAEASSKKAFPSKKLPEALHAAFSEQGKLGLVDRLTSEMEKVMIRPLVAEAADKMSGPNALKVRTFSSRMEVEKKKKKPMANELAKLVAQAFFFPLTGRWWVHLKAYGSGSVQFSSFLLTTYLKTLALILHASGPSTVALPQMTSEFWELLLSIRSNPSNDGTAIEALLFAFLTLLEVNEDKRRIAEEHARELLETQGWAEAVYQNTPGGDGEGDRVRMLAAGVLVRTREVVEKYQRLLMGEMFDY